MSDKKPFKILSIDGGGLKGIYSLHVLKVIEDKYCKHQGTTLSDHFDMICGTSTGGIIALGLANKMKVADIIKIYDDNATKIFPKPFKLNNIYSAVISGAIGSSIMRFKTKNVYYSIASGLVSCLFPLCFDKFIKIAKPTIGYKYDNKAISDIADKYFGNMKMNELNNLVCIPSYELGTSNNRVFKFPHKEGGLERDKYVSVKDAILSTTCAPTYFPVHKINNGGLNGGYFVDGGIWANNPSLVGIIEAQQYFVGKEKQYEKYEILSIGNIKYNNNPIPETDNERKYFWNVTKFPSFIGIMFDSNSKSIDHFCNVISKSNGCVYKRLECKNFSHKSSHLLQLDNSDSSVLEQYVSHGNTDGFNFTTENNIEYKNLESFFKDLKTYDVKKL